MAAAIAAVQLGGSIKGTAKRYGIPRTTLLDKVKGKSSIATKMGRPSKMEPDMERELVDYALQRADMGLGITKQHFLGRPGDTNHCFSLRPNKIELEYDFFHNFIVIQVCWRNG